ncbi:hypothetical protein L6R49_02445 [Myxococcota bacterium]|nr:hypothetical protein [Myxococcota bacterium]
MLTRVLQQNIGPFLHNERRLGPLTLIHGEAGSGKTSIVGVANTLWAFCFRPSDLTAKVPLDSVTRWSGLTAQRREIDVSLNGATFTHVCVTENDETTGRRRRWFAEETLSVDGVPLLRREGDTLHVLADDDGPASRLPAHPGLSALTLTPPEHRRAWTYLTWLRDRLFVFAPLPHVIGASVPLDTVRPARPKEECEDFAPWFAGWSAANPAEAQALNLALPGILPGAVALEVAGERLVVRFGARGERPGFVLGFDRLSDGERQRVVLEALALAFLRPGVTTLWDEPERFLSARDVGPWIDRALAAAAAPGGPQVVWASQHPEVARRLPR